MPPLSVSGPILFFSSPRGRAYRKLAEKRAPVFVEVDWRLCCAKAAGISPHSLFAFSTTAATERF
jgi:hypothetical protein